MRPDWTDGPVEVNNSPLTAGQQEALLAMTKALRDSVDLLDVVAAIKVAIEREITHEVAEYWAQLDEATQAALWVAPSYGGIFTTAEREIIREESA